MKRSLAMISIFALLYGCAHETPQPSATPLPIVQPKDEVVVPPDLLAPCPPVKKIPIKKYSQKGTLDQIKVWQDAYTACSGKQRELSALTAKAFNIQDNSGGVPNWQPAGQATPAK